MNKLINNILYNTTIPGHFLIEPLHQVTSAFQEKMPVHERVGKIALGVIFSPVIAVSFVVGALVKGVALCGQSEPVRLKRVLHIEESGPQKYPEVARLARLWQQRATQKQQEAKKLDPVNGALFEKAALISRLIAECLEQSEKCKDIFEKLVVCKDDTGCIQAIGLTKEKSLVVDNPELAGRYLHLALLVTCPHNIRSCINAHEPEQVQGAGSLLIDHFSSISAQRKNRGIYAEVNAISKPFYKKMGFKAIAKRGLKMEEPDQMPMVLWTKQVKRA